LLVAQAAAAVVVAVVALGVTEALFPVKALVGAPAQNHP
jgi:hypothetical protein